MNRLTNKDLMKNMGLQVGDRIKIDNVIYTISTDYLLINENTEGYYHFSRITYLVEDEVEYEILPKPKKVGQLTCREIKDCRTCPLWWICFIKINEKDEMKTSLYEMLDSFAVEDQEIYNLLKARLDKEVCE